MGGIFVAFKVVSTVVALATIALGVWVNQKGNQSLLATEVKAPTVLSSQTSKNTPALPIEGLIFPSYVSIENSQTRVTLKSSRTFEEVFSWYKNVVVYYSPDIVDKSTMKGNSLASISVTDGTQGYTIKIWVEGSATIVDVQKL